VADVELDIARVHLKVCARFADAVASAGGRWDRPSPCTEWNARALVEHVIGFHDVLLLRPLDAKPQRPRDDPERRWSVTVEALADVFTWPGLFDRPVEVPGVGNTSPTQIDARRLVPTLSQDVLVHTWDLARAVDADDHLDPDLCRRFLDRLPADPDALVRSGMFGGSVSVPDDSSSQTRLLARLGRDPNWRADSP
jgi:uncharacterized protein (TIGR03086 family)